MELIKDKVTKENCFEIFKLSNSSLWLKDIRNFTISFLVNKLILFYESKSLSENHEDPYIDQYKQMNINDIHLMLSGKMKSSTIASIMVIRNWWCNHKDVTLKEKMIQILGEINDNATYIPRSIIIFMRKLRDNIINEINSLTC